MPSGMTGEYIDLAPNTEADYISNGAIVHGLHDLESDSDDEEDLENPDLIVPTAKHLDDVFTLEQRDPKHRRGDYLALLKGQHDKDPSHRGRNEAAFFIWVDQLTTRKFMDAMLAAVKGSSLETKFRKKTLSQFYTDLAEFQAGVKYKGVRTGNGPLASARKYRIDFSHGQVMRLGKVMYVDRVKRMKWVDTGKLEPYSTREYASHWSGEGWGIWVQGLDGTFYSNRMRVGRFQHSSFLSGSPVGAAGEWQVNNGIITKISGRSGHYKPKFEQFLRAMRELSWQSLTAFINVEVELFNRLDSTKVVVHAGDLLKHNNAYRHYKLDPNAL